MQNYLFNQDIYEIPLQERLEISTNLRREMLEISGLQSGVPLSVEKAEGRDRRHQKRRLLSGADAF